MHKPIRLEKTPSLWQAKAHYLLYFAAVAALMPFLVLFYEDLGLSGQQIGLLTGIAPLVTIVSASLWGGVADATRRHKQVLLIALSGATLVTIFFRFASGLPLLLTLVVVWSFFLAPVIPLVDNAVLGLLGESHRRYGRVRLWGAVGFGVSPPIVGFLVTQQGIVWAFAAYGLLMAGCIWLSTHMTFTNADLETGAGHGSGDVAGNSGAPFRQKFWALLSTPAWLLFLGVILIAGMGAAAVNNFLFLHMRAIGAGAGLMGVALTVAMVSEIGTFLGSEQLLARWRPRQLLMIALLGHALRLLLTSTVSVAWAILPIQLLHSFSFALIWITAVQYARELAPAGMGATAQGMLSSVMFGAGGALGSMIAGVIYHQAGSHLLFRWAGIWVMLGVALLVASERRPRLRQATRRSSVTTPRA